MAFVGWGSKRLAPFAGADEGIHGNQIREVVVGLTAPGKAHSDKLFWNVSLKVRTLGGKLTWQWKIPHFM